MTEICGMPDNSKRHRSPETSDEENSTSEPPANKSQKKISPNSSQETIIYVEERKEEDTAPSPEVAITPSDKKASLKKPLSLIHDYPMPKPQRDLKERKKDPKPPFSRIKAGNSTHKTEVKSVTTDHSKRVVKKQ